MGAFEPKANAVLLSTDDERYGQTFSMLGYMY